MTWYKRMKSRGDEKGMLGDKGGASLYALLY
jgi:hypothetical protein